MKNLYSLNEGEKNRILNLHEGASKKQHLMESPQTDYLNKLPKETQDKFYKLGNSWGGLGTNVNNLLSVLKTFTPDDYSKYNQYLSQFKPEGHSSFQGIINGEMENDNLPEVINIAKELKRLGVNVTYKTITNDRGGRKLPNPQFEKNSFRTNSGGPTTQRHAATTQQPAATTQQPAATTQQPAATTQPTVQQKRQQITQQTQRITKEVQKLLGQPQTGKLDSINVERMIDLLKK